MVDLNSIFQNIGANWDKVTTVVLAGWGAMLSTIIYLQDRPRIKVGVKRGAVLETNTKALAVKQTGQKSEFSIQTPCSMSTLPQATVWQCIKRQAWQILSCIPLQ